jgi:hypothetical protein
MDQKGRDLRPFLQEKTGNRVHLCRKDYGRNLLSSSTIKALEKAGIIIHQTD